MASPPPQQQGGGSPQNDNTFTMLWIIAAIGGALYLIWTNLHAKLSYGFVQIKLYEALLINIFTHNLNQLILWLQQMTLQRAAEFTLSDLAQIATVVGQYLKWPGLIFAALCLIYAYLHSVKLRFRQTYTMQRLINKEEENWPQILPISKINLVNIPLDKGPWASSLTPLQFVKKYKIFKQEPSNIQGKSLTQNNTFFISLLEEPATRLFSLQLGRLWNGVQSMPPYMQALFAAFAAKACKDSKVSNDFLSQISKSSTEGKLNFAGLKDLLNKYYNRSEIQKVCQSHAYVYTVMASMLELARTDGVLSTADFLWLKPVDRQLWYVLNTVGRQTPFVEVAGIFSHWVAEKQYGRAIVVPLVVEAVNALSAALKEILYVPDEKEQV